MNCVLDASGMLAFLRAEPGGDVVRDLLDDVTNRCFVHAVNLCEVYYIVYRDGGAARAQQAVDMLLAAGTQLRSDLEPEFWQRVGRLKAEHSTAAHTLALADTFLIALAQVLGAEVVTADHREMDPLVPLGLCTIRFIR
jgi:PIN domain nuclease of toxin-antitoxin system